MNAEIHLDAIGLGDAIKKENTTSSQNRAKAMIFLSHHLDEILKIEYLTTKDPLVLWNTLKERWSFFQKYDMNACIMKIRCWVQTPFDL